MKLNYAKIRFLLIIILVLPFVIHSQNSESLWTKITKNEASQVTLGIASETHR